MNQNRYGAILSSLQGFDQHKCVVIEEEETWTEQKNILHQIHPIEQLFLRKQFW